MEYKLLTLVLLYNTVCVHGVKILSRMVEGNLIIRDKIQDFKYVAYIHNSKELACVGFFISDNAVITAASCFDSLDGNYSSIYVFDGRRGTVHLNENYNKETKENDIAIIALHNTDSEYEESYNLASVDTVPDTECMVVGFGDWPRHLYVYNGTIYVMFSYENVTVMECAENATGHICAGLKNETYDHGILCTGDIGAPLICNNELVGLAVSDSSCGTGGPDLYQSVKDLKQWIEDNMNILTIDEPSSTTDEPSSTTPGSASTHVLNPLLVQIAIITVNLLAITVNFL